MAVRPLGASRPRQAAPRKLAAPPGAASHSSPRRDERPRPPPSVEFCRLLLETARSSLSGYAPSSIGRRMPLSAPTRQMHLGVFVLGAGNHSAGWRWEGAAVSNNDLAVIQEIARIAERGNFDLLFVSDGLDYEQGDLP